MKRPLATIRSHAASPLRWGSTALRGLAATGPGKAAILLTALIVIGIAGTLSSAGSASPAPSPTPGPEIQYGSTWSLADLVRHADAGEILMIASGSGASATSATARPGATAVTTVPTVTTVPILAAKTTDGQWVRVDLSQTQAEAITALRALGYGRLMSDTADAQYDQSVGRSAAPPSSDGASGPFALLIVAGIVGLIVLMFMRLASGASGAAGAGAGGGSGSGARNEGFTTLYPPGQEPSSKGRGDNARRPKPVTFDDVAGVDEAKLELAEVVDFLRDPERFTRLGASIPRGVLLFGGPGLGKTLLAKATAHEAGVAFTFASGSDFVERYVGVGASRVRGLFKQARAAGKGIIFIDEIDALARARSSDGASGHQEADQTLNALLAEMDGFTTSEEVIVIAATNRIDTLDPAILRPGRFNRKISIPSPDREAREAILRVHAKNKPLDPAIDLAVLARKTGDFSGAMLADLLNEAAIFAARRGGDEVAPADVDAAWVKVAIGVGRKRSMPLRERAIIAAHEAGHAICGRVHATGQTVTKISMFRHGDALGFTASHSDDELLPDESALRGRLVSLMGGRAAEALLFNEVTPGARDDLEKATDLAASMVTVMGLGADPAADDAGVTGRGALGYLVNTRHVKLDGEAAAAASRATKALLDDAYATAIGTLREHLGLLNAVAAFLVAEEEMSGEEFADVCEGRLVPDDNALATWRHADAKPREHAEIANGSVTRPVALRPVAIAAVSAYTASPAHAAVAARSPTAAHRGARASGPERGRPARRSALPSVRGAVGGMLRGAAARVDSRHHDLDADA